MSENTPIDPSVFDAFSMLSTATMYKHYEFFDTIFDVYVTEANEYLALITTDYADPLDQSRELKSISDSNNFEFVNLIKPYTKNNETIEVLEHDEMNDNFFVTTPYKNYRLRHYLANLKYDKLLA